MATVELVGITGLLFASVLAIVMLRFDDERMHSSKLQIALGIIPALLAVVLVAVPRYDLVPDSFRLPSLAPVIVIAVILVGTELAILRQRRKRR